MITFNDIRINDDKDEMYIDCVVDSDYQEDDVWISSIQLVYYNNMLADGLVQDEDQVVTVYDDSDGEDKLNYFAGKVYSSALSVIEVDNASLDTFDKGLFYIIVTCDGDDVPEDVYQDYVVAPDWEFIYSIGMPFVANIATYGISKCEFPRAFEEFVIIWYALQLAFATCEFSQITVLWNKFLRLAGNSSLLTGGCPCN